MAAVVAAIGGMSARGWKGDRSGGITRPMPLLHILLALSAAAAEPGGSAPNPCAFDERAMLGLDFRAFDQDLNGGWRSVSQNPACRGKAADLIKAYREFNIKPRLTTLYWHEGQLRAEAGEVDAAVSLMALAKKEPFLHGFDQGDWNAYVDATIAFLRGERRKLLAARKRLAEFPVPEGYRYRDAHGMLRTGRPPGWPYNLDVVDGLIRCFGRSYAEAYGSHCRTTGAVKPRR